ncbi:MAG: hypothetical protein ACREAE_08525 [Nitrosopumilaceae archaeon]
MLKSYEKLNGKRYLGNKSTKEVHDLEHEKLYCKIVEVILAHREVFFDTLIGAHRGGYRNCAWCIGPDT